MRTDNAKIKEAFEKAYNKAVSDVIPEGWYSTAQIREATGLSKAQVCNKIRAIKSLNPNGVEQHDYKIVTQRGVKLVTHYHFVD